MSYDALRKGRISLADHAYLVTTVTAGRIRWFEELSLARAVVCEMRRLDTARTLQSLAWVLMPDHLHWLLKLQDDPDLAAVMQVFKGRSARAVNRRLGRTGAIWQRAYYDRAVRQSEDVRQIARYLAANPLRAGLVTRLGDYPHWDAVWLEGDEDWL